MSQENLEVVREVFSGADVELTSRFRDDEIWAAIMKSQGRFYDPAVETVFPGVPGDKACYRGLDELRIGWLNWIEPWASYRTVIDEIIDLKDRVVVLYDTFGRLPDSQADVTSKRASIITFRDGKIRRWEIYEEQAEALKAVGLED